jgi:formylglycine-generating enzyme required for sulfatase activity
MFHQLSFNVISKTTTKVLLICLGSISTIWSQEHISPPMVNIPPGSFMMGSDLGKSKEKPRHSVTLPAFQMGKYLVTVAEFKKFAIDTDFKPSKNCNDHLNENWMGPVGDEITATWDNNRYVNSEYQPVTCVTWQDANDYANWLSDKTGIQYRLPTEQEWEYSVKANTTSRYFWGDDPNWTQVCSYGNFADHSGEYFASKEYGASYVGFIGHVNCDDGEAYNAIVGLYRPNPFGLFDMVGNVKQHLGQCYYSGYQTRSEEEMETANCEYTSIRGSIWHFSPALHTSRGRYKKTWTSGAVLGFRLATNGHSDLTKKTDKSTLAFETNLKMAQTQRLDNRPRLPTAPSGIQLTRIKNDSFKLSWLPNDDPEVIGYEIYQSNIPHAHFLGNFYQRYYDKTDTVSATTNSINVTLAKSGVSFRVVAKTANITSLPSKPAVFTEHKVFTIPGRINLFDSTRLENAHLRYREAKDDKPELYYLLKFTGPEQLVSKAEFNVDVKKSAWYTLNYRGKMGGKNDFFKLWRNNKLVGNISYDSDIDDKTSNRHKVFLEQGTYTLEMSVVRDTPDRWHMVWLEFSEVKD